MVMLKLKNDVPEEPEEYRNLVVEHMWDDVKIRMKNIGVSHPLS